MILFGVKNGVAVFQRAIDRIIEKENLCGAFLYIDNITIAGHTQSEHDQNVKKFLVAIAKADITLNKSKSVTSVRSINILGYHISSGIKPDPERLRPLKELPSLENSKPAKRALGMFVYYVKWIHNFSDKIRPLVENTKFPLETKALEAFKQIKQELEVTALKPIDESLPFEVECDASDVAFSAALNQDGHLVVFMSKALQGSELKYHIIEKEAIAIVEAVQKWSHYLTHQHFTLITDQRSVAFMFSNEQHTKIKNAKIQDWRLELSTLDYTIKYRPGKENVVPDILSHTYTCSFINSSTFVDLHIGLCHLGIM